MEGFLFSCYGYKKEISDGESQLNIQTVYPLSGVVWFMKSIGKEKIGRNFKLSCLIYCDFAKKSSTFSNDWFFLGEGNNFGEVCDNKFIRCNLFSS